MPPRLFSKAKFSETETETCFPRSNVPKANPRPSFPKPKPRLFSETKFSETKTGTFFSDTKFFATETQTLQKFWQKSRDRNRDFLSRPNFQNPKLTLFIRNQILRNRNPPKIGKSLKTEKFETEITYSVCHPDNQSHQRLLT